MRYFKGKQFKQDIILVAVGYYCRFSLSYRDVSEILKEHGVSVHPTTIMRWVHEYGHLIYQICKKKNKTAHQTWHLDETYIKVKGEWCYLYRAIDGGGGSVAKFFKPSYNLEKSSEENHKCDILKENSSRKTLFW
ncbi:IS6 family transposase [Bacillus mycoides]|uniref:IS6 family transposase n=1 Tax=Bacillus mycoides TaxID=1405 RepID=UPI003D9F56D4